MGYIEGGSVSGLRVFVVKLVMISRDRKRGFLASLPLRVDRLVSFGVARMGDHDGTMQSEQSSFAVLWAARFCVVWRGRRTPAALGKNDGNRRSRPTSDCMDPAKTFIVRRSMADRELEDSLPPLPAHFRLTPEFRLLLASTWIAPEGPPHQRVGRVISNPPSKLDRECGALRITRPTPYAQTQAERVRAA